MILFYLLATFVAICNGLNAEISYQENCFNDGGTLTIQAKYTGTGTPQSVVWSYSGVSGSFLTVLSGSCTIFGGSIPAGFPAGITQKCPATDSLPANTYQLIVSGLLSNESDKTWGVTFTPPLGLAPGAVNLAMPALCTSCKCDCEGCKTRVGICISFSCIGIIAPEVIFVVGLFIASFSRTKLVVFAAIVIVIEIISGGVCISVPAEKCCIECCENWYKPSSIGFAVVSFLVGVAGIAEFVLVLSNRIGPGRNAYNAKEPDENHGMTGTSM